MTLRVRISIVPFGDESQEREIHQINISNLWDTEDNFGGYKYGVEVDKYNTGEYDVYVYPKREDGPLLLSAMALDEYLCKEMLE